MEFVPTVTIELSYLDTLRDSWRASNEHIKVLEAELAELKDQSNKLSDDEIDFVINEVMDNSRNGSYEKLVSILNDRGITIVTRESAVLGSVKRIFRKSNKG